MPEQKGKVNLHCCKKGHRIVTINVEDGTTPFTIPCEQCRELDEPGKGGFPPLMQSQFYHVPQRMRGYQPSHEWRKPTEEDYKQLDAEVVESVKEHVSRGGLMLFTVSNEMLNTWRNEVKP